jgi:hypothetical protein
MLVVFIFRCVDKIEWTVSGFREGGGSNQGSHSLNKVKEKMKHSR